MRRAGVALNGRAIVRIDAHGGFVLQDRDQKW